MSLRVKAKREIDSGTLAEVTPESAKWEYVGFSAQRLLAKDHYIWKAQDNREVCVVILNGKVDVHIAGIDYTNLGKRQSVFESIPPYAVYVPANLDIKVTALTNAELAFCSAPDTKANLPVRIIYPEQMKQSERGEGSNKRYITDILPQTEPAQSLLVVEVITPNGHSSSYPPHKHDQNNIPHESYLEETYYHQINPPQGFVFQRVYTDDRRIDESHALENHDVMMVPEGYHPVVVPHGYDSYYLNVMAGPERVWHFNNDPNHEWILKKE